jgi:hypothetical protein
MKSSEDIIIIVVMTKLAITTLDRVGSGLITFPDSLQ